MLAPFPKVSRPIKGPWETSSSCQSGRGGPVLPTSSTFVSTPNWRNCIWPQRATVPLPPPYGPGVARSRRTPLPVVCHRCRSHRLRCSERGRRSRRGPGCADCRRPHSALGNLSPKEYPRKWHSEAASPAMGTRWNRLLDKFDHRPWAIPERPWSLTMCWRDLLFMHWPLPPHILAHQLLPAFRSTPSMAWLGLVSSLFA